MFRVRCGLYNATSFIILTLVLILHCKTFLALLVLRKWECLIHIESILRITTMNAAQGIDGALSRTTRG